MASDMTHLNGPNGPKNGGRTRGKKGIVPPSLKASVKRMFKEVAGKKPKMIRDAIEAGIQAKPPYSFQYLQLLTHYVDGKPSDKVDHGGTVQIQWKTEE